MKTALSVHEDDVLGQITMFDRMIFRGYLLRFFAPGALQGFLAGQAVLLKQFAGYVAGISRQLNAYMKQLALKAGREYRYLGSAMTRARGKSKEELAREIAEQQGIREGLICVLATVEPCTSFRVRGNRETQKLELVRAPRKCLHYYLYLIDREFGFMHIRLQSWFAFTIQIYINGREWLARQMDAKGISYRRYENSFVEVERLEEVQRLCERFSRRRWVRVLDAFARRVNPLLSLIRQGGGGSYWWVLDQAEIATDVMYRSRQRLEALMPEILKYAVTMFSSEDVLRFLGRKLHGNLKAEVTSDMKRRPEGYRVKHRVKGNSIKVYDKWSVLRVETTITQPREFKVLRVTRRAGSKPWRQWKPMGKGVANLWRYLQVGRQANRRYVQALAEVKHRDKAVEQLDGLCRPVLRDGKRFARLQPLSACERQAFSALLSTDHVIHGVRNRDVRQALYGCSKTVSAQEARRRCARVSRLLRKLWAHRLISRVRNANLYRVTPNGYRTMSSILAFHRAEFAEGYETAA